MYPASSDAYLAVTGETIYGTQPFPYKDDHGQSYANDLDYSECYLIARIWSTVEDAAFSFTDIRATVIPEPISIVFFSTGLVGAFGFVSRRRMRKA